MSAQADNFHRWNDELSDREAWLIGKVVAQWGALEHEVFVQTLMSFDAPEGDEIALPKAMNNLQFTEVLNLWKERVADKIDGARGEVYQREYERILELKEYRDALVHSMLAWSNGELSKVNAVRIRKQEIVSVKFSADDLEDFFGRVGSINFNLRFPGGIEKLAHKQAEIGFYASRRWLSLMTGDPLADEWLSSIQKQQEEKSQGGR